MPTRNYNKILSEFETRASQKMGQLVQAIAAMPDRKVLLHVLILNLVYPRYLVYPISQREVANTWDSQMHFKPSEAHEKAKRNLPSTSGDAVLYCARHICISFWGGWGRCGGVQWHPI